MNFLGKCRRLWGPIREAQIDWIQLIVFPHNFLYCVEDTDNELRYHSELSAASQRNKLQWSFSTMTNCSEPMRGWELANRRMMARWEMDKLDTQLKDWSVIIILHINMYVHIHTYTCANMCACVCVRVCRYPQRPETGVSSFDLG